MKSLKIPYRFKNTRQGQYLYCSKCRKNFSSKCGMSGNGIKSCSYPESHQYQSKVWDSKSKSMKTKRWDRGIRDYDTFARLHAEFRNSQAFKENAKDLLQIRPAILSDCIEVYADHVCGFDVPEYAKKENSEKYIKNQIGNLKHLKMALSDASLNPDTILIDDFDSRHVLVVFNYLSEKFQPKTFNDKVSTFRSMWKYFKGRGYEIKNLWEDITLKPTRPRNVIVTMEEFEKLCNTHKEANGTIIEKKGAGRIGKRNLYRPWLEDGWRLALYTGCRPEELRNIKVGDIFENHVAVQNLKVSRLKGSEVVRLIPISFELRGILEHLIGSQGLKETDYILAPMESNRLQVSRILSSAFSHYWKQVSDRDVRFYDLRTTYATEMVSKFGAEFSGTLGLHTDIATTLEHYVNNERVIEKMSNIQLFA